MFLILVTIVVVGCQKKPEPPATAKVSGTVLLDKQKMKTGEIRFSIAGQAPRSLEIKDGAFSGEVLAGKNQVEVYLEKDGPPPSTDPKGPPTKINTIDPQFWGGLTTLKTEIPASGASDLKYEVTLAR